MPQRILHFFEPAALLMMINWQPVFGIVASLSASVYYLSMIKINVVDRNHNGSWRKYIKSLTKIKWK